MWGINKSGMEEFAEAPAEESGCCCLSHLWLNKEVNGGMTIWVNRRGTLLQIVTGVDERGQEIDEVF